MKKILFSFICLSQFLFSQPDTLWTKALGGTNSDVANTVKQTVDGGFITIGSTESFGNSVELWLIKIDLQGNEVWNQTIGGSGADFGKSIGQTQDGGYIITGSTNSPEYDADDSGGATSVLLIKTDSIGVEEWYRIFNNGGGTGDQNGNSVISTSDGGYAIIGRRVSNYDTNAWVIKTDFNGVEEWNQVYGGNDHDTGNSIQQTNDNGYILCGQTDSFGNGNNDIWLIKTDSNGNEMWSQTFGGNSWEIGISVQITNDGGYIILGSTTSFGNGNSDVWLIKTDSNGNEQWNQTFGGNNSDSGYSVQQTLDNGYIISGSTQSFGNGSEDGWLIKTDFIGNEQWNQAFGGTHIDRNLSIDEISDGGFIISGYTRSFGAGDRDFWLLRVESPSYGCTDPLAFNYDPDADTEDFSCEYIGCTDDLAINFDPQATIDSGDCYYLSDIEQHFQQNWQGIPLNPMGIYLNSAILDEINLRVGDEIAVFDGSECVGIIQLTDEITSPVQIFLSEDDPDTPELDGFLSGGNISYKFWDASGQVEVININSTLLNGDDVFTPLGFSEVELQVNSILGCTEISSINYNPEATINDSTCIPIVTGCMDIYACNYDPDANIEGSCLYYDCAQICDGSSYVDDCDVCDDDPLNDNECYGCMDQWALNYDPSSTIPDESCDYPSIGDISMDGLVNVSDIVLLVGVVLDGEAYIEYMDINQDTYLNIIDIVILVDIILNPETLGCTDPNAPNYDPDAIYSDMSCEEYIIDIDGNIYTAIIFDEQIWMGENLRVTHYRNGDEIPTGYSSNEWLNLSSGAFTVYNDDLLNIGIYGNLYNWYTSDDDREVCPEGFHVPSDEEWMELEMYLGMSDDEAHNTDWRGTNQGSQLSGNAELWNSGILVNNPWFESSGFLAFPGGELYPNDGYYYHIGHAGYFWSSTSFDGANAWRRLLLSSNSAVLRDNHNKHFGFSIRCIKDSQ